MNFSEASDVWAFGVTAWEIFTLGQTPYIGMSHCPQFVEYLQAGNRLAKPAHANFDTCGPIRIRCHSKWTSTAWFFVYQLLLVTRFCWNAGMLTWLNDPISPNSDSVSKNFMLRRTDNKMLRVLDQIPSVWQCRFFFRLLSTGELVKILRIFEFFDGMIISILFKTFCFALLVFALTTTWVH